jgi:hypothetical protein
MKTLLTLIAALGFALSAITPATAQITENKAKFWEAILPGGEYMVNLETVTSISHHQYIVQAGVRVWEMTIADASSTVARFYVMEPLVPNDGSGPVNAAVNKATDLATRSAQNASIDPIFQRVVKDYPTSTHAHTVEYRLDSKTNLEAMYKHLRQALHTGIPGTFRIDS